MLNFIYACELFNAYPKLIATIGGYDLGFGLIDSCRRARILSRVFLRMLPLCLLRSLWFELLISGLDH